MTDYTISSKLSNETVYACYRGRFWRWDGSIWKESHLMTQKFERAKAADKKLTPPEFLSNGAEFAPLDEYEIDSAMLDALENAKPCKNAPIEPMEEHPTPSAQCSDAATAAESQTAASPAAPEGSSPTTETADAASGSDAPGNATGKNAALSATSGSSLSNPAAPTFDFSALGELSEQAVETDQQFDLHYGTAQDEYLISCIYVAKMHALTAKAGRYGGGTWTKWYESKGMSKSSVWNMLQTGEGFKGSTVEQLTSIPELSRKDLNLIARSGCAEQLTAAAGDSQRVQELLAQLKAKEYKLNETQARLKSACIQEQESRDAMNTANAQLEAANADIKGLTEQNDQLRSRLDAAEAREEEAWKMQTKAMQRAKTAESHLEAAHADIDGLQEQCAQMSQRANDAEEALKHQPIVGVIDEEEVDRRAAEKAWSLADARNAELAKDNASLKKQVAALHSKISDAAQADFENANSIAFSCRRAWDTGKGSYSRLVGEDLETTFASLCETLNSIREEAARLCRQPPEYDGGGEDE